MQFWQTAAQDYSEGARRLTVAFGALAPPGFNVAWGGTTVAPARDYITFAEQKPAATDSSPSASAGRRERVDQGFASRSRMRSSTGRR